MTKIEGKEKLLKETREKQQIIDKGNSIRLSADLSAVTLQAKREWHDILNNEIKGPRAKNTLTSKAHTQV